MVNRTRGTGREMLILKVALSKTGFLEITHYMMVQDVRTK